MKIVQNRRNGSLFTADNRSVGIRSRKPMKTNKWRWTKTRVRELTTLEKLIRECQSINSANNITARLTKIIRLAEKLNRTSLGSGQFSFMYFLRMQLQAQWDAEEKAKGE